MQDENTPEDYTNPENDLTSELGFPDPLHVSLPLGETPTEPEAATTWANRLKAQLELYKSGLEIRETLRSTRAAALREKEEAQLRQLDIAKRTLELAEAARKDAEATSEDSHALTYTFYQDVDEKSAKDAMTTLAKWSRRQPGQPITIILNSLGGYVFDGFGLYDYI